MSSSTDNNSLTMKHNTLFPSTLLSPITVFFLSIHEESSLYFTLSSRSINPPTQQTLNNFRRENAPEKIGIVSSACWCITFTIMVGSDCQMMVTLRMWATVHNLTINYYVLKEILLWLTQLFFCMKFSSEINHNANTCR